MLIQHFTEVVKREFHYCTTYNFRYSKQIFNGFDDKLCGKARTSLFFLKNICLHFSKCSKSMERFNDCS